MNQDSLIIAYLKQNIEINLVLRLTKSITTNLNVFIKQKDLSLHVITYYKITVKYYKAIYNKTLYYIVIT